jgi:predicted 3-demethylubiquinone-9 3-methyltransferase (glyoxalase superfamily)
MEYELADKKGGIEKSSKKIVPHLWFDKEAKEAAKFYTSIFKDSRVKNTSMLHNTPSGSVDIVTIELSGQEFMLISAGPLFKFNPSASFLVACETKEEVNTLWEKLSEGGGMPLMPLDKYSFSERYGWIQDKYGLSWQVMFIGDSKMKLKQKITSMLLFVGELCGKAEEAINFYISIFSNAKIEADIVRYSKGEEPDKEGTVKFATFALLGHGFAAMDSAHKHDFAFNEAISFMVHCKTQDEIDYYWEKLSADPMAEQCGWLKDKYGVSWQVVPTIMEEIMQSGDDSKIARVTEEFLKMKKLDIAALQKAYEGK